MNNNNNDSSNYTCSGSTEAQLDFFNSFNFWSEGVVNAIICLVGVAGNTISIPVLCSKAMDSVFNRLLVYLAVFDNLYLVFSLLDCFRKHLGTFELHQHLFSYSLYGLHNIVMTCSIYMTVFLAMERYLAVSRPIEYHNSVNSGKRWLRIARYVLPVIIMSVAFNLPKFFELRPREKLFNVTQTNELGENITNIYRVVQLAPTPLRLNQTYSFYYNNAARMLTTGVIPFCLLLAFNYGIYKAVKRRRQCFGGASGPQSQQANEENRQALLLFAIVTLFLLFNAPRNFLNLYEVSRFSRIKEDYDRGCAGLPLWVLLVGSVSHLLLTTNSSTNFFLYCLMSATFRAELKSLVARHTRGSKNMGGKGDPVAEIRMRAGSRNEGEEHKV